MAVLREREEGGRNWEVVWRKKKKKKEKAEKEKEVGV
jgi:hypothetical protein